VLKHVYTLHTSAEDNQQKDVKEGVGMHP